MMTKAKHTSPVAQDFSRAVRAKLAQKGIAVTGSTWLPGLDGSYANGERGYELNDNGTHRIRTYMDVRRMGGEGA